MLEAIRSHRRWMMFFMLVLIFPSFVFFGIQGYEQFIGRDSAVAHVAGEAITPQQFEAAQRERMDQLRQMFGANFDARMFDTPEARAATLDSLLAERALAREVSGANLAPMDRDAAIQFIKELPDFQQDGGFNAAAYRAFLQSTGRSDEQFVEDVRRSVMRRTLAQAMSGSSFVPRAVGEALQKIVDEQRDVRELRIKVDDFVKSAQVDEAAIEAYYKANPGEFRTQESARVEYLVLTLDDVASRITVPDAELRRFYDQNVGDKYMQRTEARKKAEALLAEVRKDPARFAEVARAQSQDPGSAAAGGELPFFRRGAMVKPFEDAAFRLAPNQIADRLVETEFGFHILKLNAVRKDAGGVEERSASHILVSAPEARSFEDARPDLEKDYRQQQAQKRFAESAAQFTNTVYEQADSLKPAADALGLKIQAQENLTREGAQPKAGGQQLFTPRMIDAVFSDDAVKKKRNTEAIEVAPNTLMSARVVEHRPAVQRPLADVRGPIKARLERQEATRLAREAGAARLAALRAAPADSGFGPVRVVTRGRPEGLAQAAINAIMQVPAKQLPAYVGADTPTGDYLIFNVLAARQPEAADAERRGAQLRAIAQQAGTADDLAYLQELKRKYKAQVASPELKRTAEPAKPAEGK
jgi:peptidyl-prolyl cis-trans isomerase D